MVVDHQAYVERKAVQRLRAIPADPTHPLNEELTAQTSAGVTSGRLVSLKDEDDQLLPVTLPSAIRLFNATELGFRDR